LSFTNLLHAVLQSLKMFITLGINKQASFEFVTPIVIGLFMHEYCLLALHTGSSIKKKYGSVGDFRGSNYVSLECSKSKTHVMT